MAKIDIKEHVTNTIINQIEAGTPPWRKPWTGGEGAATFPTRHNGEPYKGINILVLWATASERDYISSRWMTFKQALELGGCVKKGAKAARSVFYGSLEVEGDQGAAVGEDGKRTIRYAKTNNVFNADVIEGLPEEFYVKPAPARDLGTEADPELDAFFADSGAKVVTTDEPRAYYSPSQDHIHMPPIQTFYSASEYYGVLGHETGHFVLSEARLGLQRAIGTKTEYAYFELVAELTSVFLAVHLGVEPNFDQSSAYIENWLNALKNEKEFIFKAAADAQKAFDYILAEVAKSGALIEEQKAA